MRDEPQYKGLADLVLWVRANDPDVNRVVELGAAAGESAFLWACNFPEVHCVDTWDYTNNPEVVVANRGDTKLIEVSFDMLCMQFPKTVHKHKGLTRDVVKDWTLPIDLLYVDADHSYDGCKEDILLWAPFVRAGGWITGHDFGHPLYPGVRMAVADCFPHGTVKLFSDTSWLIRKGEG